MGKRLNSKHKIDRRLGVKAITAISARSSSASILQKQNGVAVIPAKTSSVFWNAAWTPLSIA